MNRRKQLYITLVRIFDNRLGASGCSFREWLPCAMRATSDPDDDHLVFDHEACICECGPLRHGIDNVFKRGALCFDCNCPAGWLGFES